MSKKPEIEFFYEGIKKFELEENKIKKWILQLINTEGSIFGFINIIFCSDEYLLDINKKYLNKDYFTDVISFGYTEEEILNTDIYISKDRIKENCKIYDESFNEEILRIIAHGILHQIGYKDDNEKNKNVMREREDFYIKKFDEVTDNNEH